MPRKVPPGRYDIAITFSISATPQDNENMAALQASLGGLTVSQVIRYSIAAAAILRGVQPVLRPSDVPWLMPLLRELRGRLRPSGG